MISIIIPAYNSSQTLYKTVQSVLNQTYNDIEIVIVNDGSKDDTQAVIEKLIELNPEKIIGIKTVNQGVTAARLTGVRKAAGEWIGFVDADDYIEEDMYELLMHLANDYHADIVHCGLQMVSTSGERRLFYNTGRMLEQNHIDALNALLEGDYIEPSLCNKMFKKDLFCELLSGKQDKSIHYNEDLLMNYYLFSRALRSVYIDECKYHYLVNSSSATHQKHNRQRIYDPIRVKEIILNDAEDGVRSTARKVYLRTCINIYNGLMRRKDKEYHEDETAVRKKIIDCRSSIPLLSKKQQLLAGLILLFPKGYRYIYRIYAKHFLKSRYL